MPGSIKTDDGSGNYTILTNAGSLGSDKTITIPNTTGTLALTSDSFGKVLQVVQATSSTSTNRTATSYGDTTLTGSITPSATGSKVLVLISQIMDCSSNSTQNNEVAVKVVRTISSTDTDIYENTAFMKLNADYGCLLYTSPSPRDRG